MRSLLTLALLAANSVVADPIKLVCQPSDPRYDWSVQVTFDLDEWTFFWAKTEWELVGGDSRAVVARFVNDSNWPSSMLIDRETGRFWRTAVGRFCTNDDCSSSRLDAFVDEGSCSVPF